MIINRSDPTETQTWEAAAAPIHQRPTGAAEEAGHSVARADGRARRV